MNTGLPLLSVIIPVYNAEEYLNRCVESVRNQTYSNLEIILIDDGSSDKSGEICDKYAAEDKRIRVIHKQNGGQSSARNMGLDIASGELIGFVDSDDYIQSNMYEFLFYLMNKYHADISCCNYERLDKSGHIRFCSDDLDEELVLSGKESLRMLLSQQKIIYAPWNKLYKRNDFWDKNRFIDMIYEDQEITARCLANAKSVIYSGKPLYYYWRNEKSTTMQEFSAKQFDAVNARKLMIPIYQKHCPELVDEVKISYITTGIFILHKSSKNKKFKNERKKLCKDMDSFLKENRGLPFTKNQKMKIRLYKMSLPIFDLGVKIFNLTDRNNSDTI